MCWPEEEKGTFIMRRVMRERVRAKEEGKRKEVTIRCLEIPDRTHREYYLLRKKRRDILILKDLGDKLQQQARDWSLIGTASHKCCLRTHFLSLLLELLNTELSEARSKKTSNTVTASHTMHTDRDRKRR